MNFETRPVESVPVDPKRPGSFATFIAAFAELPRGTAIFLPLGDGSSLQLRRNSAYNSLRTAFSNRAMRTSIDKEKNGVWFWWEPKP